jgi:hypothetical protein
MAKNSGRRERRPRPALTLVTGDGQDGTVERSDSAEDHRLDVDAERDIELDVDVVADLTADDLLAPIYAEAERGIRRVRRPIDAELQVSELVGLVAMMIAQGVPKDEQGEALSHFLAQFVDYAERQHTPAALSLLRVLGVIGPKPVRTTADAAAGRLSDDGVADRAWVRTVGTPTVGRCWRYGDRDGSQEAVTLTFSYGSREHALSVLIDHTLGGGVKDCWVTDDPDRLWQRTASVDRDPRAFVEGLSWPEARDRLRPAVAAPPCPVEPDQVEDVANYSGLLHARLALLDGRLRQRPAVRTAAPRETAGGAARPAASRRRSVLQLKVTIRGTKPPIWRRLEVPADITLDRLHPILLAAFGWGGGHLHAFDAGGRTYGRPDPEVGFSSERGVRLSRVAPVGGTLRYTYDFGDDWDHLVTVEKRAPAVEGMRYPRCTGGRRAAPPDDCGGVPGYEHLLEAIGDPTHEDHEHLVEWFAGMRGTEPAEVARFDPAWFDPAEVTAALAAFAEPAGGAVPTTYDSDPLSLW